MEFSHRDRRMHRTLSRALGLVAVVVAGVGGLAAILTSPWLGLSAVVGLALLGGAYLTVQDRWLDEYARDLRAVQSGRAVDGFVRAEVQSSVALDPAVVTARRRSPHVRVGRPRGVASPTPTRPAPSGPP